MYKLLAVFMLIFTGCVSVPKNVKPAEAFELPRYLGTWYEIARLDHSFERGMERISATYSMREDGGVKVHNRGYKVKERVWGDALGKAYFVKSPDIGHLKVSFFGPFYGSYIVMDTDYQQYTMICGPDTSYLWILSRTPVLDAKVLQRLIDKAKKRGFETEKLIFVKHEGV